jgi:two-component system, chemotaxis family, CheB/CheR fusion protein
MSPLSTGYDPTHTRFPIVGIGASAGGLRALQRFLGKLPDDTGMAFVVIVHLDPHHESQMAELLQASTAMPVRQVTQSLTAQPNHVYIIPPDRDLAMSDGDLRVAARAGGAHGRAPIDLFFRTLAETHEGDAIGVILSGTGSDGSQGVRWIKERGGVTMAQQPADAEYPSMPRSAIETGQVDVVLSAAELGAELARLRHAASTIALPAGREDLDTGEATALEHILEHVRQETGLDFTGYKHATILRRLERRMQFTGTKGLVDYLGMIRDSPAETTTLFNDFLICVTSFFRDPEAFDALEREVVPTLFAEKGSEDYVRVWVAGCATGEEAFSLVILLSEYADRLEKPPKIQVFATDVHEKSFTFAREGLYPESITADVSPERLDRFFTREAGGYRVKKTIREKVLFATHDLLKDPPFLRLDLVSCRNVLIYLQRETQQRLLELFHFSLRPRGYLFLGSSESSDLTPRLFTAVERKRHIYRSLDGPHPLALRSASQAANDGRAKSPASRQPGTAVFGAVHQRLVEAYAPPSLVVNGAGEVVHLSNRVGRYLHHTGGEPTSKLVDMVEGELRAELGTLLRTALRTGKPAEARGVRFAMEGKRSRVDVSVRPLSDRDPAGAFALVVFDERPGARPRRERGALAREAESSRKATLGQLEDELKETRTRLAATSEEHEATIEELRASNEELQSITEEQRAVAEELEASKEELQSINEELRTVNQEHRIRNEELANVNSDLINLIDSTDIGTLFLDRELHIRRYTPPVAQVFNFVSTDIGRPLSHVTHGLDYPDLKDDVRTVLTTLMRMEREVKTGDGRWFLIRLSPYRSIEDKIDGVVLTLVETTARKHAELERESLLTRVRAASTAKSNFISAMSHEFRTPLNAILGYAEILREGAVGPLSVDQQAKLERIADNARHLEQMVKEILASARGEQVAIVIDCGVVDVNAVVREVAKSLESLAVAKRLGITVDVAQNATNIITDATKLRQILVNLLGNAIRYTDRGRVSLRARVDGETIIFEVEDTGIGIAPEHLEQIFERFWQVDQTNTKLRGGTGLGLVVTRDLAHALGGDVEVESAMGRGSIFRVRLPRDSTVRG